MHGKRFFDTNIVIYAFTSGDPRCVVGESLLAEGGLIGVQVLNEFTSVARRKLGWSWQQIEAALAVIDELFGPARLLTAAVHANAVVLARDNELSFYDALIVAAALDAGCQSLLTEDMQHGQKFGALTIENPFRE
jgi:predicted nucleic acid-binding protein